MKIIFSRKGFDSGYGKMPSPILPGGRLLPLPIPSSHDDDTMGMLDIPGVDLKSVIGDLSESRFDLGSSIHYDPQLSRPIRPGVDTAGWLPSLGQSGAAQSHLAREGVGKGDVFLFFGWFRQADVIEGRWRFLRSSPNLHVLFGWLEVEHVLPIVLERGRCLAEHPWIKSHPHAASPDHYTDLRNTIYVGGAQSLYAAGRQGGGTFRHFTPSLQLTKSGETRRMWDMPDWLRPGPAQRPLSYHGRESRWQSGGGRSILQSVDKGQEFVLHCDDYPEAPGWAAELISANGAV